MPGVPISERRQIAMIREMMTVQAAASTATQPSGKRLLNDKFHYASWFEAGSKLVADLQPASKQLA